MVAAVSAFNEKTTVEKYIVEKLIERKWEYVHGAGLEREDVSEPLLLASLERLIKRLNSDVMLDQAEIGQVINALKLRSSGIEGVKEVLRFLKNGVPLKLEREKTLKYIKLFDYQNINNNEFIVTNQVKYQGVKDIIIPDIVLYVNGIPVVIIECKNPVDPFTDWQDGYNQVKDYEKAFPEFFKYCQFGIAAEQMAKYFPIVPWQAETHIYQWKSDVVDPVDATMEMLSKDVMLDLIRNFIFFREEKGKASRVMARYMQYRAANKIYDRVMTNLGGKDKKRKGLVWHWQGSGKTLTMIFAARKLYRHPMLENPTIFFIVDRLELEEQLDREFGTLDIEKPEVIGTIRKLKSVLMHDEGRGKRGLMVTLVHKFRQRELEELLKMLEEKDKETHTFLSRKNIVALVDEGHRTQYGILAAQMKSVLRNAFFFGFTGTPIVIKGRDTYREFGYPDRGEPYLDRYFITDSIEDGFTVKIAYQPRLEEDVKLNKGLLETFLQQDIEEIPENIRQEVEAKVKGRLNKIKVFLKHPERINKIAKDISEHFSENIDGKFKALVVAVDREACVNFKMALDQYLPPEYSEVVVSYQARERKQAIKDYKEGLRSRYKTDDMDEVRKEIIEKFKDEEFPKVLIVTDMLLTGFDAPILQVMYLYKPLKDHRLLQALARTNRPFGDVKEQGLIIDYVGIFDEIGKAFGKYAKGDIKGVIWDIKSVKQEFTKLIANQMAVFKGVDKHEFDRKALFDACDVLIQDEKKSREFLRGYRKLRRIFELLGSETIKLEYLNDYRWLSAVYVFYNRLLRGKDLSEVERYSSKYFAKTVRSIYRTTEIEKIRKDLPLIAFDENYMRKLEERFKGKEVRAVNIVFALNRFVLVERSKNPLYETLVQKVERLVRDWRERKKTIEQIYNEGVSIVNEVQGISKRQRDLGIKNIEYSVLVALDEILGGNKQNLKTAKDIVKKAGPEMFKGWQLKESGKKSVGRAVRDLLMDMPIKKQQMDKLFKKIMKGLEYYG